MKLILHSIPFTMKNKSYFAVQQLILIILLENVRLHTYLFSVNQCSRRGLLIIAAEYDQRSDSLKKIVQNMELNIKIQSS